MGGKERVGVRYEDRVVALILCLDGINHTVVPVRMGLLPYPHWSSLPHFIAPSHYSALYFTPKVVGPTSGRPTGSSTAGKALRSLLVGDDRCRRCHPLSYLLVRGSRPFSRYFRCPLDCRRSQALCIRAPSSCHHCYHCGSSAASPSPLETGPGLCCLAFSGAARRGKFLDALGAGRLPAAAASGGVPHRHRPLADAAAVCGGGNGGTEVQAQVCVRDAGMMRRGCVRDILD